MQVLRTHAPTHATADHANLARMVFWVLLSGAIPALLLPLTHALAGQQDADGLLTALISTRRLTWYFWEQDRFLNLLPALAKPFRDPETNLHIQVFLRAWLTYLSPLAVLVFFTLSTRTLVLSIALTNAMLIASLSFYGWFNLYVQHNPFGTSLVLFALAYLLTLRPSLMTLMAAAVLCLLAYATNLAMLVFTGPFLFLLMVFRKDARARLFGFGLLNGAGIVGAFVHSRRMKVHATQFGVAPSVDALERAVAVLVESINVPVVLACAVASLFCLVTLRSDGNHKRALARDLSAPVLSAVLMVLVLSTTVWVRMNDFNIRYFLTAAIAVAAVVAYPIALRLTQTAVSQLHVAGAMTLVFAVLLLGPMGGFTEHYRELIRDDRRPQSAAIAQAAMDARTTVVVGDFWEVWPAVYEIQRLRFSANDPLPIYGAAERGSPLGREFYARAGGGSEQRALCFFATVDACMAEVHRRLHLAAHVRLEPGSVQVHAPAGIPMLGISFRLASGR